MADENKIKNGNGSLYSLFRQIKLKHVLWLCLVVIFSLLTLHFKTVDAGYMKRIERVESKQTKSDERCTELEKAVIKIGEDTGHIKSTVDEMRKEQRVLTDKVSEQNAEIKVLKDRVGR